MDISWWSSKIIESSNFFWAGVCLYLWWRCNKYRSYADHETRAAISGLQWMFAGSALNHGWFAVSRHIKGGAEYWNAAMFEWRGFWVLMTACMFIYGAMMIVRHLEGARITSLGLVASVIALISFSVGFF